MLVLMAFIMILKKENIRSIKNGIKELGMRLETLLHEISPHAIAIFVGKELLFIEQKTKNVYFLLA